MSETEPTENNEIVQNDEANNQGDQNNSFDINTVIEQAKQVILDPVGFYKNMPTSGGFANPIIFLVVMVVVTILISLVFSFIGLAKFSTIVGGGVTLGMLIFGPIMAVIGSFIGAGIMFVIWKLMGSEKDYETAYRCIAYSSAIAPIIAIISFIPYVAGIVKTLWGSFLMYTASTETHNLKAQTAKIVFGVLAAIGLLWGVGAEHTMRSYGDRWERISENIEKQYDEGSVGETLKKFENMDEMSAEEAGKQVGELLKNFEQFSKGLEESVNEEQAEAKD